MVNLQEYKVYKPYTNTLGRKTICVEYLPLGLRYNFTERESGWNRGIPYLSSGASYQLVKPDISDSVIEGFRKALQNQLED